MPPGAWKRGPAGASVSPETTPSPHKAKNSVPIVCIWRKHSWLITVCSQPGQGGDADTQYRDLRAQLLQAEAAHFSKSNDSTEKPAISAESTATSKRQLEAGSEKDTEGDEDVEAKRRRVLEETRSIDADSETSSNSSSDEDR